MGDPGGGVAGEVGRLKGRTTSLMHGAPPPVWGGREAEAFRRRGFTVVRRALDSTVVKGFVGQIARELADPPPETLQSALRGDRLGQAKYRTNLGIGERAVGSVDLDDPESWPRGKGRRVVELTPRGDGEHWRLLQQAPMLRAALDDIVGRDCWDLPINAPSGDPFTVRDWYFPVTFPEDPERPLGDAAPSTAANFDMDRNSTRRPVHLRSWREEHAEVNAGRAGALGAGEVWQPVSRRRFRGKGWHLDVGPGFPMDGLRSATGHPCQCIILLLVLSDWEAGGGGTCAIAGSHEVVRQYLEERPEGVPHAEMNQEWTQRVMCAAKKGALFIDGDGAVGAEADFGHTGVRGTSEVPLFPGVTEDLERVVQFVGRPGDVILLHPLSLHSGTTNWRGHPRLMGNGMVRLRPEAFARRGGCFYRHPCEPGAALSTA